MSPPSKRHLDRFSRFGVHCCKALNAFQWGQPLEIVPSLGVSGPIQYMVRRAHPSQHPKRHLNWLSRFCRAHERDQQTDTQTQTDRKRYSVCSNKPLSLDVMSSKNAMKRKWRHNLRAGFCTMLLEIK